jgi:hypothetical protein
MKPGPRTDVARLSAARGRILLASLPLALLGACGPGGAPEREAANQNEPEIITINQTVTEVPAGTTPMAERVAVLGLLNKRNGDERDLTLRPGQAVRIGDVIVRLLACETTAPWEEQRLTGAFVQVDVRNPQDQFQRIFSGWLYKESPSLNVVEHPVYDVWTKSCAMTHPEAGESTVRAGSADSNRSSAANSPAPAAGRPAAPETAAPSRPKAESASPPKAADNSTR